MAAAQRKLVHKQFNSPMGLYSQQNVKETLNRELKAFGTDGIEIDDQIAKPLNLANSAVLRAVEEEEEQQQMKCGYKRVAWPPASEERIVREFTPQPQTQYQPVPANSHQQANNQQPSAAVTSTQGPMYNNVQPLQNQQQQQHQQQHLSNAPTNTNTNNIARETVSPYNQNQNQYEAYPPQQPETPIVLVDKQFSRQASHEPIQTNSAPYQQQQYQQQQQSPMVQPQNQLLQQQQQQQQHQPSNNQQIYQQQYQPNNQQNVSYPHQQQQQPPLQQQQQSSPCSPVTGWKTIQPPQPKQGSYYTSPIGVNESNSTPSTPIYQQQFQNYHQQPQQQHQQQQYRAPSHDTYQKPQQQQQPLHQYQQPPQQQYSPQPQYQAQAPINQYQALPQGQVPQYQPQGQVPQYQQQPQGQYQQQPQQPQGQYQQQPQQQYQQPPWVQQPQQQAAQQQYQQPPWVQQPQQQYQQPPQQQQQQPQHQTPLNQYQAPHQQQYQPPQPQPNQFESQPNQKFNSYSQPQQQQHTVSHDQLDNLQQQQQQQQQSLPQDYRGASPGIITLRKEAPVTQAPTPVYTSQPAAVSFQELSTDDILGGCNMRGDLKWPPPEYKEAAVKENEERRQLAAGPVCRPRKVKRDYTPFFAKNALSHHYPSYKVPPGTQHMTY